MTNNKMDKHVKSNMLDDLLDDTDKARPPAPAYNYTNTAYTQRGNQRDFGWDNPNDRGFSGGRIPAQYYGDDDESDIPEQYRSTKYASPRQPTSVFNRGSATTKTAKTWGNEATALAAIDALIGGVNSGPKHYFIPAPEQAALINATTKALGEFFDQIGLCWGAGGSKNAKMLIADILANNVFYDTANGYKELDFGGDYVADNVNAQTGEVEDPEIDEERRAIMEVDGGHVTQDDGDHPGEV